jgi:N-methylhydantoinase B
MSYRPHDVASISGVMLGMRERLPLPGFAGGFPGATTAFRIHRADGRIDPVPGHDMGVAINPSDTFEFLCASGGGYGDPLMRDPARVARDVELGRLAAEDARDAYGVVMAGAQVDEPATLAARDAIRTVRLARARPAEQPLADDHPVPAVDGVPLYPGVEQRGDVAVSAVSGAPLAVAPHHWTDGCPMDEQRVDGVVSRAFLDPRTGGTLAVDVVPDGEARSFASRPDRWTHAG